MSPEPTLPADPLTRRQALGLLAGTAAFTAAGCSDGSRAANRSPVPDAVTDRVADLPRAAPVDRRALVVVELPGGNDGLSMIVPERDGPYRDARPTIGLADEQLIAFDQGMRLNRQLEPLHAQGLAVLDGIGAHRPGLSHFDMTARWWAGRPDTSAPDRTAFLGRLCDELGARGSVTGVSIGAVASPAVQGREPNSIGRFDGSPRTAVLDSGPAGVAALRSAFLSMGGTRDDLPLPAGDGLRRMLEVDDALAELPPPLAYPTLPGDQDNPQITDFGSQMAFAGQLLRADMGVRMIHVRVEGLFLDSHVRHLEAHRRSMGVIVPVLAAFRDELANAGLADRVLVTTTSEFGRRPAEHQTGLDHGTASCALVMGPVTPGLHGEPASFRRLDDHGNFVSPLSFSRYLATMAAWLGVDPNDVLEGRPRPIPTLV